MHTHPYPSDLADKEWVIPGPLITPGKQAGHPQMIELRRIVDAAFYLLRTGCQWRALPREFPPWPTVLHHYAKWRTQGTWERINAVLREQHRVARSRKPQPTAAIVTKARAGHRQPVRAHHGGRRPARVRRRQESVRPQAAHSGGHGEIARRFAREGNLLKARVHPANIHDRRGAELLLAGLAAQFPHIALLWADSAYQGLKAWLAATLG